MNLNTGALHLCFPKTFVMDFWLILDGLGPPKVVVFLGENITFRKKLKVELETILELIPQAF